MKKKLLKIVSTSTLAVIMGAGVLCGTIIPINLPQTAMSGASTAGATASSSSAQLGDSAPSQAIQLNPQTDETIFTTESGFEIKSHNVAGQTVENSQVQYFTLGSYNGTPLNWIILATSTTMVENTTPAGKAINAETSKQTFSMMTTSNLSANQALVISEKVLTISSASIQAKSSGKAYGSLPANSANGSGWYGGTNTETNAKYYTKILLDEIKDYCVTYSINNPDPSTTINDWFTGNTLSLSSYCGNKIVKNSNFNGSYYGFALTNSQANSYLATTMRSAKDINGTTQNYLCGDIVTSSYSVDYKCNQASDGGFYYSGVGSGSCYLGSYINTSGTISTIANMKVTVGNTDPWYNSSKVRYYQTTHCNWYICVPYITYSITAGNSNAVTAYYRPAMVVDLSKF